MRLRMKEEIQKRPNDKTCRAHEAAVSCAEPKEDKLNPRAGRPYMYQSSHVAAVGLANPDRTSTAGFHEI